MAIRKTYEDVAAEVEKFNRMLAEVPFHVQAEVFFVENKELTPETELALGFRFEPLIKVRIVRIFRGEGMRISDEISFRLWASYHSFYGGESPTDFRELKETKYFELLLDVSSYSESGFKLSCQRKIDEPSDNPIIVKLSPPEKRVLAKIMCRRCYAEFPQNSKFCGRCGRRF